MPSVSFTSSALQASLSSRLRPTKKKNSVARWVKFALFYASIIGFCTFMMCLFIRAPYLGPSPGCNAQIVYILFGFSIPATNYEFLWLFIAFVILLLAFIPIGLAFVYKTIKRGHASQRGYHKIISDLATRAYVIAILEQIIQRNMAVADGSAWSFGQIFSMMMLVGPLIELISVASSNDSDEDSLFNDDDEVVILQLALLGAIFISIPDLGFSAAAGAAAAATGAHVNGGQIAKQALRLGALGDIPHKRAGGVVPEQLLIAALAAGLPLTAASTMFALDVHSESALPLKIPLYTLTGYTFARVANNHGFPICKYQAAAAAGAVFGATDWVWKLPIHSTTQEHFRKHREARRRQRVSVRQARPRMPVARVTNGRPNV
ncbi:hypothetical protein FRC17_007590 [Serendipita sp. 399]|nr:hypothetical protein FRC17_007590 [Serendipita sp. 399]